MTIKNKDNEAMILPSFLDKFGVLFNDDEFGFKSDDKLLTLVMASLRLENLYDKEYTGICEIGVVVRNIYFIQEGRIDVSYESPS